MSTNIGKLTLVGLGPGDRDNLTFAAQSAISEAAAVVGYQAYLDLIVELLPPGVETFTSGMTGEIERVAHSIALARQGKRVALVCSGDSGVYALAGLVFEILAAEGWQPGDNPAVKVVPGISAVNSCAALLGAPLVNDFCTISLSDLMTPWAEIQKRVEAAAESDFVICFYNPRSSKRTAQLPMARQILLKYRAPSTPVGIVRQAYREGQFSLITTLGALPKHEQEIEMNTVVIVGNKSTFALDGLIVTPRGYNLESWDISGKAVVKP